MQVDPQPSLSLLTKGVRKMQRKEVKSPLSKKKVEVTSILRQKSQEGSVLWKKGERRKKNLQKSVSLIGQFCDDSYYTPLVMPIADCIFSIAHLDFGFLKQNTSNTFSDNILLSQTIIQNLVLTYLYFVSGLSKLISWQSATKLTFQSPPFSNHLLWHTRLTSLGWNISHLLIWDRR